VADLPSGTVTFLFTDIEGSTQLALAQGAAWPALQARHHAILRAAIEAHGGRVFKTVGDAACAAFPTASGALASALDAQRALQSFNYQASTIIRVRIGLHTGNAAPRTDGDYEGYLALATVQRVMSAGHGGKLEDIVKADEPVAGFTLMMALVLSNGLCEILVN
jgi:class 3 adenylate cyclase